MEHDCLVIGSGPSAYGAILALTQAGARPAILAPRGMWHGPVIDPGAIGKSELVRKKRFGNADMYLYPVAAGISCDVQGGIPISATPGGLSAVWGSNIEVFSGTDLTAWGDSARQMPFAYAAILNSIAHVGANDALSTRCPWPTQFPGQQPISIRVRRALSRADTRSSRGALVGLARNATAPWGQGCIACGQCLDGCPEGVIFDAAPAIQVLIDRYQLPVIDSLATLLAPSNHGWSVSVVDRQSGNPAVIHANRIFVAAGSIATAALLVKSGLLEGPATLDDTQVFYLPILPRMLPDKGATTFTLAQMFVIAQETGSRDFHLSVYESDSSFQSRASGLIGSAAKLIPQRVYRQLMAGIGFIPSELSGRIFIESAQPNGAGHGHNVVVSTQPNPSSWEHIRRSVSTIGAVVRPLGLYPVAPLTQMSNVGASYHSGVLRINNESVIDPATGTIEPTRSLHVVDGAGLPQLPTGPVTLTMMANAYRIAQEIIGGKGA